MTANEHRVLIVDDEPVVRRILRQRLSADGCLCEETGSVEEALNRLQDGPTEPVVLDIKMPGKPGVGLSPGIKHR